MIVELYGLPGSGKSTFANEFVDNKMASVSCINVTESQRKKLIYKCYYKLLNIFIKNTSEYKNLYQNIIVILKDYDNILSAYNECFINEYAECIAYMKCLYKRYEGRKRIYIFDEGINQQFINICVNYDVKLEDIDKLFSELNMNSVKSFYYDIDIENAISSIKKRNRHVCFIDELKGEELEQFLGKYKKNCDYISGKYENMHLERAKAFKENAEVVKVVLGEK